MRAAITVGFEKSSGMENHPAWQLLAACIFVQRHPAATAACPRAHFRKKVCYLSAATAAAAF